jgi:hypothetical protein
VKPAFAKLYRVLKRNSFCAFFYGPELTNERPFVGQLLRIPLFQVSQYVV